MGLINLILITAIVIIVGGGGGYLVWIKTRPRKKTWVAEVYQVTESTLKKPTTDKGVIIDEAIDLSEMKHYGTDTLERVEKKPGITVYRLVKMNKTVPSPSADAVENRSTGKFVYVLYDGDNCTLMKRGFDKVTSKQIFTAMPYEDMTMIKNEMAIRKDRLQEKKDVLAAITPWVVAGLMMLGLVAVAYLNGEAQIKISKNNKIGLEASSEAVIESAKSFREGATELAMSINRAKKENEESLGKQPEQKAYKEKPPEIE